MKNQRMLGSSTLGSCPTKFEKADRTCLQETFDAAVKENIEEFDMEASSLSSGFLGWQWWSQLHSKRFTALFL